MVIAQLQLLSAVVARKDSWRELGRCDVLLVCGDNDRAYVFRGQKYAQLIDSVGDVLRQNHISCATVARGLARLTGKRAYGVPASINRSQLHIHLGQRFRALWNARVAMNWRIAREAELWTDILHTCGAKAVIAIQPDCGLCRAAHGLGVQIYDLQHGIIDTVHNSYYREDRLKDLPRADLPGGFLTWDDKTAQALTPIARAHGIAVHVVGNPWFARFLRHAERDELVKEVTDTWPDRHAERPTILVTLQHGLSQLASDYVPNGVMAESLAEVIRDTAERLRWNIRLHPSQVNGPESQLVERFLRERFAGRANVDWKACSEVPLPLLLARADLHLTHFSASAIEAAWLGLRTGVLDPHIRAGGRHAHLFVAERAQGLVQCLPLDAQAIKHYIANALESGGPSKTGGSPGDLLAPFVAELKNTLPVRQLQTHAA